MLREQEDPTRIELETTNVWDNPFDIKYGIRGTAIHGDTPFEAPWISHIVGNLYQGGCDSQLTLPAHIKHVVSLYPWGRWKIADSRKVVRTEVEMYDAEGEPDRDQILELAQLVLDSCADGPTLVHCQAGLNRSSLVAGAALILDGMSPSEAIQLIRTRRSPACLCNKSFEKFLRELAIA